MNAVPSLTYMVTATHRIAGLFFANKLWQVVVENLQNTEPRYGHIYAVKILQPLFGNQYLVDAGLALPALLEGPKAKKLSIGQMVLAQIKRPPLPDKGAVLTMAMRLSCRYGQTDIDAGAETAWQKNALAATIPATQLAAVFTTIWQQWQKAQAAGAEKPGLIYAPQSETQQLLFSLPSLPDLYWGDLAAKQDWLAQTAMAPDLCAISGQMTDRKKILAYADWQDQWQQGLQDNSFHLHGCRVRFDATSTLTAIDVDLAGSDSEHVSANLAVIPALARLISLRNIGGIIVIDFLKMAQTRQQDKIIQAMQEHLSQSAAKTQIFGFTKTGLLEMTRARRYQSPPLPESLDL